MAARAITTIRGFAHRGTMARMSEAMSRPYIVVMALAAIMPHSIFSLYSKVLSLVVYYT